MRKISYADSGDDGRFEHRATYTHAIEEKADEVEHDVKQVLGDKPDVAYPERAPGGSIAHSCVSLSLILRPI